MTTTTSSGVKQRAVTRPGPLSSKSAAQRLAQQRKFDVVKATRRLEEEERMKLPPGWEAKLVSDVHSQPPLFEYHSVGGQVFGSLSEAIHHLFNANVVKGGGQPPPPPRRRSYSTSRLDSSSLFRSQDVDSGVGWFLLAGDNARCPAEKLAPCKQEVGPLDGAVQLFKDPQMEEPAAFCNWVIKQTMIDEEKQSKKLLSRGGRPKHRRRKKNKASALQTVSSKK